MKKFTRALSLLLVVAFLMGAITIPVLAATAGTVKTTTAGSSVTLREKASTTSKSLGSVKDGTKVSVIAKSGDFYKVTVSGKTGYIMKSYIVIGTSTTSSTTTSNTSSTSSTKKQTGKTTAAAYLYKSANTSADRLATVKKGATFDIISSTTSFYKVTYDGKTGYILKKHVEVTSSTSTTTTTPTDTSKAGDKTGVYTTSSIPKPADTVTSKQAFWNAISYHLMNFENTFSVKVKKYQDSWMPKKTSNLEYAFTDGAIEVGQDGIKKLSDDVTQITFTVKYNEAGRILQAMKNKKSLASSDTKAAALKKIVDKVVTAVKSKTTVNKVVYIHDYIVKNVEYDINMSASSYNAYGALVGGKASCQGYAEANALLLSAAGVENRLVWANSRMNDDKIATHGFNKVKLDDNKWYNVDCTVDDPQSKNEAAAKLVKDRIKRDFLLVTDTVSKQRYEWDTARYPASSTNNNWHRRNKLVATSQAELEKLVKAAAAKKEKYVSIWVADYSSTKYKATFASKISGVKSVSATTTPAHSSYKTYGTAIFFTFTYK